MSPPPLPHSAEQFCDCVGSLNGKSPEQERPAEISGRKCGALLGGAEGAGSRRGKLKAVIHEQMHK